MKSSSAIISPAVHLGVFPVVQALSPYLESTWCPTAPACPRKASAAYLRSEASLVRPRVLLADDHVSLLHAEAALLSPYFDIVATTRNGNDLVSEALRLNPDVIVADISMPILTGIQAIHQLRQQGFSGKLVFLTVHTEEEFVAACLEEGALGYVFKASMKNHLIPAIYAALAGQRYIPSSVAM
jgi:CheY-like chemotaxis protein